MSKAAMAWDAAHTTRVYIKLNNNTDADILQHLETVGNKQGYIKRLIREDMKKEEEKKMKNIVEIAHYDNNNGYSYTETIETITSSKPITAEGWWNDLDGDFAAGCIGRNEWITVQVETYADDADPAIDDPITKSEYTPD